MNHVLNIPVEVQQKSLWCWAAVSTMAVKSFSDDPVLAQMTQLRTVAYSRRGVRTKVELAARQSAVQISETKCSKPNNCNSSGVPWLFEVECTSVPLGQKLTKQRLIDEIRADRPVIIMWNYADVVPGEDQDLPSAEHYLIITGYDDVTDRFRVFDPWLGDGSIPGEPEVHEYHVSYEEYVDPEVKLGMPVSAIHDAECYNLRRIDIDAPQVAPPATDFDRIVAGQNVALEAGDFDEILRLKNDIQAIGLRRIVYAHDGKRLTGPKRVGEAFPIVGLTTRQLLHAHGAPHRLLIPRSWALIAPVVVGEKIVDSFQMYRTHETWKQGGSANTRIAQLMVKAAERLRKEVGDQVRPYLVSIPEQVQFFAACGEGEAAKLISLENVAKGPVQSGKQALAGVLKFIEVQRKNARRLRPDRPR